MSFRLNAIFILDKAYSSDEELLQKLNHKTKQIPKGTVDFFETNNRWNKLFLGLRGNCRIVCHGKLINRAFEEENFAAAFPQAELAAVIWDEVAETFGFALFDKGKLMRKVLVSGGEFEFDLGFPTNEETNIKDADLLEADEMKEILQSEGKEALQLILKTERSIHATNRLVKRYLGAELVAVEEEILVEEYG